MKKRCEIFVVKALIICLLVVINVQSVDAKGLADYLDKLAIGANSVVEDDDVRVTYSLLWIMKNEYSLGIKIENKTENAINNWALSVPVGQGNVLSILGADLIKESEEEVIVKHNFLNSIILPQKSVSFAINICGNLEKMPISFNLIKGYDEDVVGISSNISIDRLVGNSYTGAVDINNYGETLEGTWYVEFDYDGKFSAFSGGTLIKNDNHYIVKPYFLDNVLKSGETISFGFLVIGNIEENDIRNITIKKHYYVDEYPEDDWNQGDSFIKEATQEDIRYNDITGTQYVNNQIIVGVMLGTDKSLVEDIAEDVDASIVGYIPTVELYQFEFNVEKSYEQIQIIIQEVETYSFVCYAVLNYVSESECSYYPSEGYKDNWDISNPDGENWGLEALNVPKAWDKRDKFIGKTKVGIYDTMFDTKHPDLKIKKVVNNYWFSKKDSHGTHVAGIIGATFDNGIGISGVATNVDLYGYSVYGKVSGLAEFSDRLTQLIKNDVRVINISYSYSNVKSYKASMGNYETIKDINEEARALSANLKNLLLSGYDFLIVNAAGNATGKWFLETNGEVEEVTSDTRGAKQLKSSNAKYAFVPNAIEDSLVKNHVLVVGAVAHKLENGRTEYYVTDFSGRGDRVDLFAPGKEIYSTVNTDIGTNLYESWDGTSMSTPYITGIAALIWQANPMLSSLQVKNIIMNSRGHVVKDKDVINNTIKEVGFMPDAEECIDKALNYFDSEMPKGTIYGRVTNSDGQPLSGITVAIVRTSVGQSNLSEYYYLKTTNEFGEYKADVVAGTYEVNAYHAGNKYVPVKMRNIDVDPYEEEQVETIKMGALFASGAWMRAATVQGKVYDALNGNVISDANVRLRSGWNNFEGSYLNSVSSRTDSNGFFELSGFAFGNYTVEINKYGYVNGYYNVVAVRNEAGAYETMVLTPVLSDDEYRIVLTWDAEPRDLDSHLMYYDNSNTELMHVYYASPVGYINGIKVAQLDVDDTSGYGPETVTITLKTDILQNGGYFRYYVHLFAGSNTLAASNATVRVYAGNNLIETYYVPTYLGTNEVNWQVFKITKNGIQKVISGQ